MQRVNKYRAIWEEEQYVSYERGGAASCMGRLFSRKETTTLHPWRLRAACLDSRACQGRTRQLLPKEVQLKQSRRGHSPEGPSDVLSGAKA